MKINKLRMLASDKGFTLIELMIVIAIIGILAAIAIPNFIRYRDKAYCSAAETDARSIAAGLADYYAIPAHTNTINGSLGPGNTNLTVGGVTFSALSGDATTGNTATISGPVNALKVAVTDGSGRCPADYRTAQAAAGWSGGGQVFIKTME